MNSLGKCNPCPSTKTANNFWNEGNGHQHHHTLPSLDLLYFLRYRLTKKSLLSNHKFSHIPPQSVTQLAQLDSTQPQLRLRN